jgi:hypothetical protein
MLGNEAIQDEGMVAASFLNISYGRARAFLNVGLPFTASSPHFT